MLALLAGCCTPSVPLFQWGGCCSVAIHYQAARVLLKKQSGEHLAKFIGAFAHNTPSRMDDMGPSITSAASGLLPSRRHASYEPWRNGTPPADPQHSSQRIVRITQAKRGGVPAPPGPTHPKPVHCEHRRIVHTPCKEGMNGHALHTKAINLPAEPKRGVLHARTRQLLNTLSACVSTHVHRADHPVQLCAPQPTPVIAHPSHTTQSVTAHTQPHFQTPGPPAPVRS